MNNKKTPRQTKSRSSAASNSESELTLGNSSQIVPTTDSMSDHSITITPSRKSKFHQPIFSTQSPSRAEKGSIGDGSFLSEKKSTCEPFFGQPAALSQDSISKEDQSPTDCSGSQTDFSDPVYKKLARMNGEVNRMTKAELRRSLAELHLHTGGVKEVLKKRLKNFYKRKKLTAANLKKGIEHPQYDYYVVIDYEATCQENNNNFIQEIIEFPAVLVDAEQKKIVGMFREFCKPTLNPVLSDFCKQLTGVNQSEVDNASEFAVVLDHFEEWMEAWSLGSTHTFAVLTDGPWDIFRFLSKQCELSSVPFPRWARKWVNMRKAYCNFYDCKRCNLEQMLQNLGLQFEGRPHCGLDDSKNIARIVCHLLEDGCCIKPNETYSGAPSPTKSSSSRFRDTGDGMHSGDFTTRTRENPHHSCMSGKERSGLETDEEVSDLLFYFRLQSN